MNLLSYSDFVAARANLWRKQEHFKCFPDMNIIIADQIVFNMRSPELGVMTPRIQIPEPYLACHMSHGLLQKLIHRKVHWNNAEIGCLIEFTRSPNVYNPDVHMLMSFFHA